MVTLSTAYGLCTLIDQQGFLFVTEDENDCALVTLGKNIVIRYRLSDQKQLSSWSTIAHLSSKVVYDQLQNRYLGIFNENIIKQWTKEDTNLDKVSRIKLKDAAHEILLDEEPVILFKSGACCKLSYLENKNYEPIADFLAEDSKITASCIVTNDEGKFLILIALIRDVLSICYSVQLNESLQPIKTSLKTIKLRRRSRRLLGSCFVSRPTGSCLITLWSDGFLYSLPLPLSSEVVDPALPVLGQFVGVVSDVSTSSTVAMTGLSAHHVAIYGGDPAEEGAVLAVYNLDFGMIQASTSFKLLQKPPRVWAVQGRLLVGLGQRLVCVPYTLLTGSVAALVGTRPAGADSQSSDDIMAVMPCVTWEQTTSTTPPVTGPSDLRNVVDTLAGQGCSEAAICETIITGLLEKHDVKKLTWCLDHFLDIPEVLIVRLLHFTFSTPDHIFTSDLSKNKKTSEIAVGVNGSTRSAKKKRKESVVLKENGSLLAEENSENNPVTPPERALFLNRILKIPANRNVMVAALRRGLSITDCLSLLQYFTHLLSSGLADLEKPTIHWATTVIDAFYQQLVLGRHTQCVESVLTLKAKVEEEILALNELSEVLPVVNRLKNRKEVAKNPIQSKNYSIQKFQLYQ